MRFARRVIESEPHLFFAEETNTLNGALIWTYVSPLVDKLDPLWYSVRKTLAQSCHAASELRVVQDDDMLFGHAELLEFEVFDSCPGDTKHYCVIERSRSSIAQ